MVKHIKSWLKGCTRRYVVLKDKHNDKKTYSVTHSKCGHYYVQQFVGGYPTSNTVRMSLTRINELAIASNGILLKEPKPNQKAA